MIDVNNLCNGCMREMKPDEAVCSFCGWNRNTQDERTAKCLPKETILNGRYLIGRVLGEGGFGVTYLAMDLATETRVAIKEYFPVGLASRDFSVNGSTYLSIMSGEAGQHYKRGLNSFADEGQILSGFGNLPGIVDAKDFFFENNTAYLVMEYVEGQSLKEHMRQRRQENQVGMDYRVAIALLEPVMASLVEIHKKHLMHRDISPDNIIMGSDGNVKLIDFGAARADMGNSERSLTVMVKHGYAPEEQYRSHGKQGAWTDVYALCATLYHMISGTLPEDGVERLYQDRVAPLSSFNLEVRVPQEVSDVIAKGMAVRAENRYQSMQGLHFALTQAQAIQTAREQAEAERKKAEEEAERLALEAEWEAKEERLQQIRNQKVQEENQHRADKEQAEEAAREEAGRQYEEAQRKKREEAEAERRRQETYASIARDNGTSYGNRLKIVLSTILGILIVVVISVTIFLNSYSGLLWQGDLNFDKGSYNAAEEYYLKAIDKDPQRAEAYEKYIDVQVSQNDTQNIIKYVEKAESWLSGSDRQRILDKFCDTYCENKLAVLDYTDDASVEKLLSMYPDRVENFLKVSDAYFKADRYKAAEDVLRKIASPNDDVYSRMVNILKKYHEKDQRSNEESLAKYLMQQFSDKPDGYLHLSDIYLEDGDIFRAEDILNQADKKMLPQYKRGIEIYKENLQKEKDKAEVLLTIDILMASKSYEDLVKYFSENKGKLELGYEQVYYQNGKVIKNASELDITQTALSVNNNDIYRGKLNSVGAMHGNGVLMGYHKEDKEYYHTVDGTWENGMANGYCTVYWQYCSSDLDDEVTFEGNVINNLFDGDVKMTWKMLKTGKKDTTTIHVEKGKRKSLGKTSDGKYIFAKFHGKLSGGYWYTSDLDGFGILWY